MKAVLFSVACLATAVTAQSSSACAADYILETCLGTETNRVQSCSSQDYSCLCDAYSALLTCFNNCPNDSRLYSYTGTKQIYCSYVSQFSSATTSSKSSAEVATLAVASATTTSSGTSATGSTSSSGTSTASATDAAKTNSAADLVINAGSVLAAVAGAVVALL